VWQYSNQNEKKEKNENANEDEDEDESSDDIHLTPTERFVKPNNIIELVLAGVCDPEVNSFLFF